MKKVIQFLNENAEKIICVICLSTMSVLIVVQVFFRYVLQNSISWSEEIARYLFIWLIYIGISYGVKEDKHIAVEAIANMLPEKGQKVFAIISDILFLFFAVLVLFYGTQVVGMIAKSGQLSPASHIPMQLIYAAPVIGFALVVIRLIQNIGKAVRSLREPARNEKEGA